MPMSSMGFLRPALRRGGFLSPKVRTYVQRTVIEIPNPSDVVITVRALYWQTVTSHKIC